MIKWFKKSGISNAMDGIEYDIHFDHNMSDSFPSGKESNENFIGFQTFSLFEILQNQ